LPAARGFGSFPGRSVSAAAVLADGRDIVRAAAAEPADGRDIVRATAAVPADGHAFARVANLQRLADAGQTTKHAIGLRHSLTEPADKSLLAHPAQPAPPGPVEVVIDPKRNRLRVYIGGKLHKTYPIALGKRETPTPIGDYKVINKHLDWGGGFGTRWIGLNVPWGIYGIHGTNRPDSIGHDASHGCVRMLNFQVEELYRLVRIGTPVRIMGHYLGELYEEPRILVEGNTGADVQLVQSRLKSAGFYRGPVNGRFTISTQQALRAYEKANRLPVNGSVGFRDYIALGLLE
jgi:hypothetical protein